ncbi:hypothetical protein CD351_12585 [Erythrobacter sp. KY5]|uniref:serine hydrolase domain-containing protein n=1 Tax=Erythrobacter sp. KY5 TaxID=2011159 RepID=UPI000DBF2B6B|nr:serine hydrolase domain-containing protein [Erythrobacter sp. KY5]AWW75266.1 hypothetical protein CD351_12585 [Erythrobacter sp. KY5]
MRTLAYVLGAIVVLAIGLFVWALWMIKVPAVAVSSSDFGPELEAWFDARHGGRISQFNGAALVIHDGKVVVRKAWGLDGDGRALTADSQFRLASVSKSFTAAAILKLAHDGLLDLDKPVGDQIEDCPVKATPAQFLRHVSGVPDDYFERANPDEITTIGWVFDHVCSGSQSYEAPTEYQYNNTGYVFLAGLVKRVSGQSFESYLRQEVLAPLGMDKTRVWNLVSADDFANRATSFNDDGKMEPTNLDGVAGDGAVFSTLDDLANWVRFWRDDRLISRALKDRATGRGIGDGYHFGLNRNGDLISHNGAWLGARTYLGFKDDGADGDVVILLDNSSSIFVDDMASEIWTALEKG